LPQPLAGRFLPLSLALATGIAIAPHLQVSAQATAMLLVTAGLAALWLLLRQGNSNRTGPVARPWNLLPWRFLPAPINLAAWLLLPIFILAGHQLVASHHAPPSSPDHVQNLLLANEPGYKAAGTVEPLPPRPDLSPAEQPTPPPSSNPQGADFPADSGQTSLTDTSLRQGPGLLQEHHDVVLVGILAEMPRRSGARTRLILEVEELRLPAGNSLARGLVQLTVNGGLTEDIRPGERLMVRTRLGPVRSFAVPGAFDYQKFLAHRGIWLSGWVADPIQIIKVRTDKTGFSGFQLRYLPERLRTGADALLEQHLTGHQALPVLKALLIGDRGGIAPATLEIFKAGGAMHLLAISGMHLGLIALMSIAAAEWLLKRSPRLLLALHVRKAALLLALLPIMAYALITGLQPPAMRALIMILVFIGAVLCNRQWCSLNNLGLAALIILVMDPPALFGASFQLSFAATAGILMLAPRLQDRYRDTQGIGRKIMFWILASLLVSTVATLVTAPLAMHHFHRVALLSPITTLLATPLIFFWTMPLALTGLALAALGLPGMITMAGLLLTAATWGLDATVAITAKLAALPFSFFYLAPPSGLEFLAWLGLFGALALHRRHRAFLFAAPAMALLLLLLPLHEQWQRQREPNSRISFIEVGHGAATVVEMPGNRTVLVDGGGPATLSTDVGEQLIAPFLRQRRIRRLEAVVISHPHADHYNGMPFLLRNFRPRTLWINGHSGNAADYDKLLELAYDLDIEIKVPEAGELLLPAEATPSRVKLKNRADFHLRDLAEFNPPLADPLNDQSLVISYRHDDIAVLLPGDIGVGQERRLVADQGSHLSHQVLAASHHGRWTSMAPEFVAAINPDYLVVSDNEHRVDNQRIKSWQQLGIEVLTSGRHGTISCTTDGRHLECRGQRTGGKSKVLGW
jgi:competence protein ComEC